jgi:predicted tellurium resistance membrane protein TerC
LIYQSDPQKIILFLYFIISKFWDRYWRLIVLAAFIISLCITAVSLPFNATTQMKPFIASKPELGSVPLIFKYDYYVVCKSFEFEKFFL